MKRLIDIILTLLALIPIGPFLLIVMLILRFTGEGKVWFPQQRVGYGGKLFTVFKLVTMRVGSETKGNKDITIRDDPRVLPFGRFLRKTKINELPQLLNILKGDMSIVGWRPLVPRGFSWYPEEIQKNIVKVKPGLTGIGSIIFRDEEAILSDSNKEFVDCYSNEIAPYKGRLELWYIDNYSLLLDFKIIFCTAWVIFFPNSQIYLKLFKGLPEPDPDSEIAKFRARQIEKETIGE